MKPSARCLTGLRPLQDSKLTRKPWRRANSWCLPSTATTIPYRADRGHTVGNIIRQGQVLYSATGKRNRAYPVLDNLVLRDDGSMEVYAYGEVTAEEIAASGTAHDMFSFGPVLVRDGELMVYTGSHCDADEPRMSIGMIVPDITGSSWWRDVSPGARRVSI